MVYQKWLGSNPVTCYNNIVPIYKKVNKDFFKKWTPAMAYVLGFFAADGYITVNKRGGQFWCIQIVDKKLLCLIRKVINSDHKINIREGVGNIKDLYRLQIGSIEMCDDLRKLGYGERKTYCLTAPLVPRKYLPDFIRGYFDGDGNVWVGYVHKERVKKLLVLRVVFTSCSLDFLDSIRERLEKENITNGALRKQKGNYYRLSYSIKNSLKLYTFMYNSVSKTTNDLFLDRKKKVFERFLDTRS